MALKQIDGVWIVTVGRYSGWTLDQAFRVGTYPGLAKLGDSCSRDEYDIFVFERESWETKRDRLAAERLSGSGHGYGCPKCGTVTVHNDDGCIDCQEEAGE